MKYLFVSIFILLAALVLIFTKYALLNRLLKEEQVSFISETTMLNDEIKKNHQNISLQLMNSHLQIDDFEIIDKNGIKQKISDILSSSILVLRKTEFGCTDCFERIIAELNNFNKSELNNVIIIFSTDNTKDINYYVQQFDLQHMTTYYSIKTSLPDTLEKGNLSYFFTIDQDFIIHDIFIPDINNKACINDYLSMLKRSKKVY